MIKSVRVIVFFIAFIMLFGGILYGVFFSKKKGIDINSFSGMFEMYSRMFKFEDKLFSITMLVCMYGGALLVSITIGVSFWAEGKGCVFPTKYG